MVNIEKIAVIKGGRRIFSDLDLKVHKGDHVLIKGPSGAGKSTLLKAILFFEEFSEGKISLNEDEVTVDNLGSYRNEIAYVGQKAPHFEGLVRDFLVLPFSYKNNASLNCPEVSEIEEVCKDFSFGNSPLERNYSSLSGGEQQRISIIQTLLLDKPVYLLDEVTASLDPDNKHRVVDYFCKMKDKTLLIVSHDSEWEESVNRIVVIENGSLKEVGNE